MVTIIAEGNTMSVSTVPQGPWYNPALEEGSYNATITEITEGKYGKPKNAYLQCVFWLPDEKVHVVTNFYLSSASDTKTGLRINRLCQAVGRLPDELRDSPRSFVGDRLQITIKRMVGKHGSETQEFYDVDLFLPAAE